MQTRGSPHLYVGLMSGTSMDGVDAALVEVDDANSTPRLRAVHTEPMDAKLHERLEQVVHAESIKFVELCELDTAIGRIFATATGALLSQSHVSAATVRAIGSHGQTIYHHPFVNDSNSLQIGNPNIIAELTGITTIADVRRRDMAAGGQGAPLLPALHQRLFAHPTRTRGVLNVGGISNLTVLPAGTAQPSAGFDTGPGNTLMDGWIRKSRQMPMDRDGMWAAQGQVNESLLAKLTSDPYFNRALPKSTGVEYFNLDWLYRQCGNLDHLPAADVQRTLARLTAVTVASAAAQFSLNELWIVGGGSHNPLLLNDIRALMPCPTASAHELGIDVDNLEAMAFAWFAHCHLEQIPVMPTGLTGARHPTVLGACYPA